MVSPLLALCLLVGFFIFLPVLWAWQMICHYAQHMGPVPPSDPLPKAAVLLSVRGADPSLPGCLAGLLDQDYPGYAVRITVDSVEDPAWKVAHDAVANSKRTDLDVRVDVLRDRLPTCSLKCSAHLQAAATLDPDTEVVATLDADSIAARDWLRAMVQPFADPKVGVATGIRWFSPPDGNWGSLVRHFYNAGSFPQMYAFDIGWGGSLAIRGDIVRSDELRRRWSRGFCEDLSTIHVLHARDLELAFVPAATQICSESISLVNCVNFLTRQLLCVRVDHPAWWGILICNEGNLLALVACAFMVPFGLLGGNWPVAVFAGALLLFYAASMYVAFFIGERLIRTSARLRGQSPPPMYSGWRIVPALFMAQFICDWLMLRLIRPRPVTWRGITYTIHAPGSVLRGPYSPFRQAKSSQRDSLV